MRFGAWEIALVIVLVLIVFGSAKLSGLGKSLGRGIREFREEIAAEKKEPAPETKDPS